MYAQVHGFECLVPRRQVPVPAVAQVAAVAFRYALPLCLPVLERCAGHHPGVQLHRGLCTWRISGPSARLDYESGWACATVRHPEAGEPVLQDQPAAHQSRADEVLHV